MMMSRGCVNNSKFAHSKFKMKDVSLFKKPERIITGVQVIEKDKNWKTI
jgi:hypothetical protein